MSETPTLASLFARWSAGGPAERQAVYAHLREHPAEAAAAEAYFRDALNDPRQGVIAAEAVLEVYEDQAAAAAAVGHVLRLGDPALASDAAAILSKFSLPHSGPLLVEFARHSPDAFRAQPRPFHEWAGAVAVASGPVTWFELFSRASDEAEQILLVGLAGAAPEMDCDLSPLEEAVRARLTDPAAGYAAGCALWRITWRVNDEWLATITPASPAFDNLELLRLVIDVLIEHLGRRRDLAPLIAELIVRLDDRELSPCVRRLANLGARGWSVLLPLLSDPGAPAHLRAMIFNEAATRPAVFMLAQHHAHAVILARQHDGDLPDGLVRAAAGMLAAIGAPAGSALADILDLIVKQPHAAPLVVPAISALAPGHPNAAHAVARTLDRLRRSTYFRADAFAALAALYAPMAPDSAPKLAEDTSFDPRTPDLLVQQPAWKEAPPEARRRDALALADLLASPRPDVRSRAAELLRHYTDQMPAVWPALVATLAGADEKLALSVLPYFHHLAPAADAVANELTMLFREPNPAYAARAAVAWNGVYQHVSNDTEGGFLFLALMCAHGSQGFAAQKIWMIKHQRLLNLNGLAEAKGIVERAIERLTATATAGDRRACVRDYFGNAPEPPKALTDLLDHPFAWYRWAGLELLDAFGAPHRLPELLADRAHDRSALVRTRALRMLQG